MDSSWFTNMFEITGADLPAGNLSFEDTGVCLFAVSQIYMRLMKPIAICQDRLGTRRHLPRQARDKTVSNKGNSLQRGLFFRAHIGEFAGYPRGAKNATFCAIYI